MAMAVSMAAMMAPSAAPFFIAYGRDSRRPIAIATVVLLYVAAWAAIGLGVGALMDRLMMPVPSWPIAIAALGVALLYTLTPWARSARARCHQMCGRAPRGGAVSEAAVYTASCVACSAGLMAALVALGMSNLLVLSGAAAAMLVYKLI
jgi:predicted metal-binding membrane protein